MRTSRGTFICSLLGTFLGLAALTGGQLFAQSSVTMLYEAYYNAYVYPERFDEYVNEHPELDSAIFWHCWDTVQSRLAMQFQQLTEHCRILEDPQARQECLDVEETKISLLLDAMAATIKGEVLFADTPSGTALILAKMILGDNAFEAMHSQVVPNFRSLLLCR